MEEINDTLDIIEELDVLIEELEDEVITLELDEENDNDDSGE